MQTSPLCDAPAFVRNLEKVYYQLYDRWVEGTSPWDLREKAKKEGGCEGGDEGGDEGGHGAMGMGVGEQDGVGGAGEGDDEEDGMGDKHDDDDACA